jgi:hypothetical protein
MLTDDASDTPRNPRPGEREDLVWEVRGRSALAKTRGIAWLGEDPGVEESQEGIGPHPV